MMIPHKRILSYAIAIIAAAVLVYYLNMVYNAPQPLVVMNYNYTLQAGAGYVNNTLPFAINISAIYCTVPGGEKIEFSNPTSGSANPGSNTFISLAPSGNMTLPQNCGDWSVIYTRAPISTSNTLNIFNVSQRD